MCSWIGRVNIVKVYVLIMANYRFNIIPIKTSITSHIHNLVFCFGSISSFFLELFLYSSPVAYWAPNDLGSSSFSVICFCLFILFMGFSRQELVCHSLFQWTTFCQNSHHGLCCWVALHGMSHSFIELDKAVVHVIRLVSFL